MQAIQEALTRVGKGTPTTAGIPIMEGTLTTVGATEKLEAPVVERTATAVGPAATEETLATAGTSGTSSKSSKNNNSSRNASNTRDHYNSGDPRKLSNGGNNISNSRSSRIIIGC
jgi:hypothetical protein